MIRNLVILYVDGELLLRVNLIRIDRIYDCV